MAFPFWTKHSHTTPVSRPTSPRGRLHHTPARLEHVIVYSLKAVVERSTSSGRGKQGERGVKTAPSLCYWTSKFNFTLLGAKNSKETMSPAPTAPARWRRKRPRVVVLLTTALCCLPSVAGFGFSGVGALSPTRTAAADAALVRARGQSRTEWTNRRAHDITCKVSSPRRYGSAVSPSYVCAVLVLQRVRNTAAAARSLLESFHPIAPGTSSCLLPGLSGVTTNRLLSSVCLCKRCVDLGERGERCNCCYCLCVVMNYVAHVSCAVCP